MLNLTTLAMSVFPHIAVRIDCRNSYNGGENVKHSVLVLLFAVQLRHSLLSLMRRTMNAVTQYGLALYADQGTNMLIYAVVYS